MFTEHPTAYLDARSSLNTPVPRCEARPAIQRGMKDQIDGFAKAA